jgi:hypothetical protein
MQLSTRYQRQVHVNTSQATSLICQCEPSTGSKKRFRLNGQRMARMQLSTCRREWLKIDLTVLIHRPLPELICLQLDNGQCGLFMHWLKL